jgi:hypothetical protein
LSGDVDSLRPITATADLDWGESSAALTVAAVDSDSADGVDGATRAVAINEIGADRVLGCSGDVTGDGMGDLCRVFAPSGKSPGVFLAPKQLLFDMIDAALSEEGDLNVTDRSRIL